jgi:hypothetical protein
MTKFEHPFAKVCRAVLKEKYPDKEAAIPDGSPLAAANIPEDVIAEAIMRYCANEEQIITTPWMINPTGTAQRQKVKHTTTYT